MDKRKKREIKTNTKHYVWFFVILFPILILVGALIYALIPSLVNNNILFVMLLVVVGGITFFLYEWICKKLRERKEKKLSNGDPYSD